VEQCFTCDAGEPSTCNPIVTCVDDDGCCAPGCDPGNDTDCIACSSQPLNGCLTAGKISFQVKDHPTDDSKDQLKWKFVRGAAVAQADLGNPSATTTYRLCVYDTVSGADALAGEVVIGPNANWDDKNPQGWKYKDRDGLEDGVGGAQIKTGIGGKSKAQVKAKGANVPTPAPVSGTKFFTQDPRVTVQLMNDATPTCWTTEFTESKRNDPAQYKAKN
jgi:hypothetical protein